MNETFYHASNIGGLKELLPLSTMHGSGEKVCYFTKTWAYALFYLRDMMINHVTCGFSEDGVVVYHEQFDRQLETIYKGRSGYLYTCENNENIIIGHTNGVWAAKRSIPVSEEVRISDVYAEILKAEQSGAVQVIRYVALSDEKKNEITEIMKNSIIKHNYLNNASSPKAHFFKANFPQAWENALQEEKRNG